MNDSNMGNDDNSNGNINKNDSILLKVYLLHFIYLTE